MAERLVLCGSVDRSPAADALRLSVTGRRANIALRIEDLDRRILKEIPTLLLDLLEIAAYVYAADRAQSRGGATLSKMGASWRREFRFVIPVRNPEIWLIPDVIDALTETLGFMSDDSFAFDFKPITDAPPVQEYLDFAEPDELSGLVPDEIVLFSGGVDSLAGSAELLALEGKSLALVSHRAAAKVARHQRQLVGSLRERFTDRQIMHIPVHATRVGSEGSERTQRTRSFLYASLAAVVAAMIGRDRILFFENGIISLNLPPTGDVLGSRATRTTHPKVLADLSKLISLLLGKPFGVENPYFWLTKADVFERLAAAQCADLVSDTISCTRVRAMRTIQTHCGACSQCLDRRFGALAAGLAAQDPSSVYRIDLFLGDRAAGPDRAMAEGIARRATEIDRMDDVAFFARFNEATRAALHLPGGVNANAKRVFDLYKRYSRYICHEVDHAIGEHANLIRERSLPEGSLLAMVARGRSPPRGEDREPVEVRPPFVDELRISFDQHRRVVSILEAFDLTGTNFALLDELRATFEQDLQRLRAPEEYRFTGSKALAKALQVEEPTLRKQIFRLRRTVQDGLAKRGRSPPCDIVESKKWRGYRLNPAVRLISQRERSTQPGD